MPLLGSRPPFIGLKVGDLVLVQSTTNPDPSDTDWWMGWVVRCAHRSQCIDGTTLYEVKDADTGELRSVDAEHATRLVLAGMDATKVVPLVSMT